MGSWNNNISEIKINTLERKIFMISQKNVNWSNEKIASITIPKM